VVAHCIAAGGVLPPHDAACTTASAHVAAPPRARPVAAHAAALGADTARVLAEFGLGARA
jgi:hypothetical protein